MQPTEQRSAFRIPLPDGQKHASLRVEGRSFDVQMLDASATGVAIACPLQVTLNVDDRCELHSASDRGLIRIVRKEVFSDGILLGAVRIGDAHGGQRNLWGQVCDFVALPLQAFAGCNTPMKIGLAAVVLIASGVAVAAWQGDWLRAAAPVAATLPAETQPAAEPKPEPQHPVPAEAQLPTVTPVVSESDQRALRIFEQQKQLLARDTARRLKLSPAQENQIQRAIEPAEAAAKAASPDFWDAIRRSEQQILTILTPAQIKSWRQQSGA